MCQLEELFALRERCAVVEAKIESARVMPTDPIEYFNDGVALAAASAPSALDIDRSSSAHASSMPWIGDSSLATSAGYGVSNSPAVHIWRQARDPFWRPTPFERTRLSTANMPSSAALSASDAPSYYGSNVSYVLRDGSSSQGVNNNNNNNKNASQTLVQLRDYEWLGRKISFESNLSSYSRG